MKIVLVGGVLIAGWWLVALLRARDVLERILVRERSSWEQFHGDDWYTE